MENVYIKTEYITLGQLLKFLSIVGSGGEVKMYLSENHVILNGEPENRRGKKIYPEDSITIGSQQYLIKSK